MKPAPHRYGRLTLKTHVPPLVPLAALQLRTESSHRFARTSSEIAYWLLVLIHLTLWLTALIWWRRRKARRAAHPKPKMPIS